MKIRLTQETLNRLKRFRKNKRAFWSLIVLVVAYLLSLTSPWTVNDEPLLMRYQGKTYFPAFVRYSEADFGGEYQTDFILDYFINIVFIYIIFRFKHLRPFIML